MEQREIETGCAYSSEEGKGMHEFGSDEINAAIQDGWRVSSISKSSAICKRGKSDDPDMARFFFTGFACVVTLVK